MTSTPSEADPKPAPEFPLAETLPAHRSGLGRMILPILLVGIPGAVLLVLGLSGCRKAERVEEAPAGTGVEVTAARAREADLQYRLGLEAAQRNDMQTAIPHLERAVELNPEHPRAHADLGSALVIKGELARAVEYFREDLRISPDKPDTHYNLGVALSQLNKLSDAIREYRLAIKGNPQSVGAHHNLGRALLRLGRTDEGIEAFEKTLEIIAAFPDLADKDRVLVQTHMGLCEALIRRGKFDEARMHTDEVLRIDPNSSEAHFFLGEIAVAEQHADDARSHYRKALELNPQDQRTRVQLEMLDRTAAGDPADSGRRAARDSDGGPPTSSGDAPATPRVAADLKRTIDELRNKLLDDPRDVGAHNDLGIALARSGRLEEAESHLSQAVRLDPKLAHSHLNLANVVYALGRFDFAEQEYRLGILHGGGSIGSYRSLFRLQRSAGEIARAANTLRQGLNDIGDEPELLMKLSWILATCPDESVRDGSEAVVRAERLRDMWKSMGSPVVRGALVLDTLAAAYAEAGRFAEAVAVAEQAFELADKVPDEAQAEGINKRLQRYKQEKPWREAPSDAPSNSSE